MSYTIEKNEKLLVFTISRPEVRNAINENVIRGLEKFVGQLEQDNAISFGIITSEGGKAFCSGGDLEEFHVLETAEQATPMLTRMAEILYRLAVAPVPVIALMDGAAIGGGCELATACDFRLMRNDVKAGFIQGTLAITTGWGGASLLCEKSSSHSYALQLLMSAQIHSAVTLAQMGWITNLYDGCKKIALEQFLSNYNAIQPSVLRAYKAVTTRRLKQANLRERMLDEAHECAMLWERPAHHEAVRQFRTKSR